MNRFNYVGVGKTRNYFEGWYLKIVDESDIYVFIFGISLYEYDPHAFIQIVANNQDKPYYYRFDVKDFYYNRESIKIGDNIFGLHELKLKIGPLNINLNIKPTVELKKYFLTKSAMGCVRYLPLPTYHEIVFMNSKVEGQINEKDFHGNGYMEKNFGTCFPKEWLWIQTNHFQNNNASFTLAAATIANKKKAFFCILNVDGDELRFATYNFFKIKLKYDSNDIKVIIEKDKVSLIIEVKESNGYTVIGPSKNGKINREIKESIDSSLTLYLYKDGELIFTDTAINVGCENLYFNDIEKDS
jgi:hypothetical protein